MTKKELLTKLKEMRDDINGESGWHHGRLTMVCQLQDWAHAQPDDPVDDIFPDPPKKARRIQLDNKEGYWYWSVWQEEGPGSWAKVAFMNIGYARIAEASQLAERALVESA